MFNGEMERKINNLKRKSLLEYQLFHFQITVFRIMFPGIFLRMKNPVVSVKKLNLNLLTRFVQISSNELMEKKSERDNEINKYVRK